jgi:hypothetical protein
MTIEEVRQQCRDFIDMTDREIAKTPGDEIAIGYLQRMKVAVGEVLATISEPPDADA